MTKPKIIFFARGYQADFYPDLVCDEYDPIFVTLTRKESDIARKKGVTVTACFEEDYDKIIPAAIPENYLQTSLFSDRFLGRFDYDKRQEILAKEISFWAGLLDEYKPAAVTNELIAIEISEVLMIEARKRNVPYLAALNCVVDDYFYWLPDPISLSGRNLPAMRPSVFSKQKAAEYFEELKATDYSPFYVKNLEGRRAILPIVKGLVKFFIGQGQRFADWSAGRFRYESYSTDYTRRLSVFMKSFLRDYDTMEGLPEECEVIFYPVHQEPEATLLYMSEFYANQIATIENILKSLAPNQVLVIKEHPVDKGALLQKRFWDLKQQYSSLYLLPAEVHGRAVLARATRVVTLTSTVGWEAAAIGKPVYVLGQIFYDDIAGLKRLKGFEQVKEKLRKPIHSDDLVDEATFIDSVAQMLEFSYPGNPFPHDGLNSKANIDKVNAAFMDRVSKKK